MAERTKEGSPSTYLSVRRHRGAWAIMLITPCEGGDLKTSVEAFTQRDEAIQRGRTMAARTGRRFKEPIGAKA